MRIDDLLCGVVAGGAQLAAGELIASLRPATRSPVAGLGRALIDLTPGPAVDATVALLEARDKPLLMAVVLADFLLRGAAAGALVPRRPRAAGAVLIAQGLVSGSAAATRPDAATLPSALAGVGGAAAGLATLALLRRRVALAPVVLGASATTALIAQRRNAVRARELEARRERTTLSAATTLAVIGLEVPGLSPLLTPNADFYETDVTFPSPRLDTAEWRLRVHGRVDAPFELNYAELLALATQELDATLVCVHNPVGGSRIGTARWLGVPVRALLERAGVRPGADQLVAHSVDGFTAGVPLPLLEEERPAMVAVGMNGEPLPFGHGYPARLLVPGLYGYDANPKWLSALEVTTFAEVADHWTRRGWPREPAHVRPSARIDVPRPRTTTAPGPVTVAGVAWAPPRGVRGVELSLDGGPWRTAELGPELAPTAWRQWRLVVTLEDGEHSLAVRTDGQEPVDPHEPPYPRGTGGFHAITVTAGEPAGRARRRTEAAAVAGERTRLALAGLRAWHAGRWSG